MSQHYTFGDSERAAARLAVLAAVFEPTTRELLSGLAAAPVTRALDLGCGPGHSTELVHHALRARETWGLDASERLIDRARTRLGPPLHFAVHDITRSPMPVVGADVAFARHVLAHLADPASVLAACATAVRPGGCLVLEETAALDSSDPVFAQYYRCVATLQAHYGQNTFVGLRLDAIAAASPWRLNTFVCRHTQIDARSMATLHAMNVRTWQTDAFAAAHFPPEQLREMTAALDAVAAGERTAPPVSCGIGQAVLRI